MDKQMLDLYLERIGLDEVPPLTPEGLAKIQRAHLESIPFENLDIQDGKVPLKLDEDSLADKIIVRKRGGICYEQNLLYWAVLKAMGFKATMRGAGARDKFVTPDHAFVMVEFPPADGEGESEFWMTDVGFGFNYALPIKVELGLVQNDGRDDYRVEEAPDMGEGFLRLWKRPAGGDWEPCMTYEGFREWETEEFVDRCYYYSTSPDASFVKGYVVSIDVPEQRLTLSGNHFIKTVNGERVVTDIESEEQFNEILRTVFKIER